MLPAAAFSRAFWTGSEEEFISAAKRAENRLKNALKAEKKTRSSAFFFGVSVL